MTEIKIFFDGGARPNPGKGYGSYEICSGPINHKVQERQFGDSLTNNQAEYMTLIAALRWLVHQTEDMQTHLKIYGDSKLVIMQVQGSWRAKCWHVKNLRDECRELLSMFDRWEVHWQPREKSVSRFGH